MKPEKMKPEKNQNIIKVKDVTKSFKSVNVLKGVNFEVGKGEIFALLGSNGSGKTTIIKIMTTLLRADGGKVIIGGFDRDIESKRVRELFSLTGQFAAIDEILTGRENLVMMAKLKHLKNPKEVADALIMRFGMQEAAHRRVGTYSGGMKRRIDIAMSLVGNPQIIYLDEPTTGLDPESRLEVWKIIKELKSGGTTIFLTTQYLEEAEQLADQIAILHDGRIIAQDTLEGLIQLLPPVKKEFVEKQPTLEEVFMTIIGKKEAI